MRVVKGFVMEASNQDFRIASFPTLIFKIQQTILMINFINKILWNVLTYEM